MRLKFPLIFLCWPFNNLMLSATMVNNNGDRGSPCHRLYLISLPLWPLTLIFVFAVWSQCHIHVYHLGLNPLLSKHYMRHSQFTVLYAFQSQSSRCILPLFFNLFGELLPGQWLYHQKCSYFWWNLFGTDQSPYLILENRYYWTYYSVFVQKMYILAIVITLS